MVLFFIELFLSTFKQCCQSGSNVFYMEDCNPVIFKWDCHTNINKKEKTAQYRHYHLSKKWV